MTMDRNARLLRSADKFFPKIMSFPDSKVLIAVADIYLSPSIMLSSVFT